MSLARPRGGDDSILASLIAWVQENGVQPMDVMHMSAMLEFQGWTDRRAQQAGYASVFALAEPLYEAVSRTWHEAPKPVLEDPPLSERISKLVRTYLRGFTFAAPVEVAVLLRRYALWSYMGYDAEIATAIALATFASFFIAGGFTQAIARRGLFYTVQDQFALARRSSLKLIYTALLLAVIVTIAFALLLAFAPFLPWHMAAITLNYFLPMTFMFLGLSLLYMLHREPLILVAVGGGILVVYLLWEVVGHQRAVSMMVAQAIAMTAVAVFSLISAIFILERLERENRKEAETVAAPPLSRVVHSLAPYFVYGIAYFTLTFVDRIMAWTKPGEFHPYPFWFEGHYELGLDWALWTLTIPMGLIEIHMDRLFQHVRHEQQVTAITHVDSFNRHFRRSHLRTSAIALGTGLASMGLLMLLFPILAHFTVLPSNPLADPTVRLVFFIAAPAYSLMTVGLQSVLLLFSLNLPWAAVRAALIALGFDTVVGFLASRYWDFQGAVLGMALGAVIFSGLALRAALRVLDRFDYHTARGT